MRASMLLPAALAAACLFTACTGDGPGTNPNDTGSDCTFDCGNVDNGTAEVTVNAVLADSLASQACEAELDGPDVFTGLTGQKIVVAASTNANFPTEYTVYVGSASEVTHDGWRTHTIDDKQYCGTDIATEGDHPGMAIDFTVEGLMDGDKREITIPLNRYFNVEASCTWSAWVYDSGEPDNKGDLMFEDDIEPDISVEDCSEIRLSEGNFSLGAGSTLNTFGDSVVLRVGDEQPDYDGILTEASLGNNSLSVTIESEWAERVDAYSCTW